VRGIRRGGLGGGGTKKEKKKKTKKRKKTTRKEERQKQRETERERARKRKKARGFEKEKERKREREREAGENEAGYRRTSGGGVVRDLIRTEMCLSSRVWGEQPWQTSAPLPSIINHSPLKWTGSLVESL